MEALCLVSEIAPESGKEVLVQLDGARRYIALFVRGEEVHAYLNTCPHQGRSLNWAPDQFLLEPDGRLICPHHGACFEISTGVCVSGPCAGASLTSVDTEVVDGNVYLSENK